MLFDLEPYIPFNMFVVICIFIIGGIICWFDHKERK